MSVILNLKVLYRQSSGFPHHERKESDVFLLFLRNNVENHFLFAIIEEYHGLIIPPFIILSLELSFVDDKIEDVIIDYTRDDYANRSGIEKGKDDLPDSCWA